MKSQSKSNNQKTNLSREELNARVRILIELEITYRKLDVPVTELEVHVDDDGNRKSLFDVAADAIRTKIFSETIKQIAAIIRQYIE